jgi:hypothetical protein
LALGTFVRARNNSIVVEEVRAAEVAEGQVLI